MEVELLNQEPFPLEMVSKAAGICYGKGNAPEKRAMFCFEHGHMSPFEHVVFTFKISGISRACLAQLTRHRLASYNVESQRYCNYNGFCIDNFVYPSDNLLYEKAYSKAIELYDALIESGEKPEDARYVLPNGFKTNLIMTVNLREFCTIWKLRSDKSAQWEIRDLVEAMKNEIVAVSPELEFMFGKE